MSIFPTFLFVFSLWSTLRGYGVLFLCKQCSTSPYEIMLMKKAPKWLRLDVHWVMNVASFVLSGYLGCNFGRAV